VSRIDLLTFAGHVIVPVHERSVGSIVISSSHLLFVTEKDGVAGTAFFQPATGVVHLHIESGIAQLLLEFSIVLGGPDGEDALLLESGAGGGYSPVIVEFVVIGGG
jgi:hypothetical protein